MPGDEEGRRWGGSQENLGMMVPSMTQFPYCEIIRTFSSFICCMEKYIRLSSADAWNHLLLTISSISFFPLDLHFLLVDSYHHLSSLSLSLYPWTNFWGLFISLQIISSSFTFVPVLSNTTLGPLTSVPQYPFPTCSCFKNNFLFHTKYAAPVSHCVTGLGTMCFLLTHGTTSSPTRSQ